MPTVGLLKLYMFWNELTTIMFWSGFVCGMVFSLVLFLLFFKEREC